MLRGDTALITVTATADKIVTSYRVTDEIFTADDIAVTSTLTAILYDTHVPQLLINQLIRLVVIRSVQSKHDDRLLGCKM